MSATRGAPTTALDPTAAIEPTKPHAQRFGSAAAENAVGCNRWSGASTRSPTMA